MFESTVAKKFKLNQRVKFTTHYHPWMLVGGAFVLRSACGHYGRIYLVHSKTWVLRVCDVTHSCGRRWLICACDVRCVCVPCRALTWCVTWLTWHDSQTRRDSRTFTNVTWLPHPDAQWWDGCSSWWWTSQGTADMTRATWLTNVTWLTHPDTQRWDGFGSWSWASHGTANAWHDSRDMTHATWLMKRDMNSLIQILNCERDTAVDDDRVTELWLWHDSRDMPHVTCFTNVTWLTNVTRLTRPDTQRWDGYGSLWVSHGPSDVWDASRTGYDSLIQKLNGEINAAVDDERVTEL